MLYVYLTLILIAAGVVFVVVARSIRGPRKGLYRAMGYLLWTAAALTAFIALISNPPG